MTAQYLNTNLLFVRDPVLFESAIHPCDLYSCCTPAAAAQVAGVQHVAGGAARNQAGPRRGARQDPEWLHHPRSIWLALKHPRSLHLVCRLCMGV